MEEILAKDRTVMVWVVVLSIAAILINWLAAEPRWVATQIGKEGAYIESLYGQSVSDKIIGNAQAIAARVYRVSTRYLHRKASTRWGLTRGQTARLILTQLLVRIQNALMMALLFAPVIIAGAVDGGVQRAIAKSAASYINPVRFNIGFHFLHASYLLIFGLIAVPVAVHPGFFAVYWLIVTIGVYTVIKYLHHRI